MADSGAPRTPRARSARRARTPRPRPAAAAGAEQATEPSRGASSIPSTQNAYEQMWAIGPPPQAPAHLGPTGFGTPAFPGHAAQGYVSQAPGPGWVGYYHAPAAEQLPWGQVGWGAAAAPPQGHGEQFSDPYGPPARNQKREARGMQRQQFSLKDLGPADAAKRVVIRALTTELDPGIMKLMLTPGLLRNLPANSTLDAMAAERGGSRIASAHERAAIEAFTRAIDAVNAEMARGGSVEAMRAALTPPLGPRAALANAPAFQAEVREVPAVTTDVRYLLHLEQRQHDCVLTVVERSAHTEVGAYLARIDRNWDFLHPLITEIAQTAGIQGVTSALWSVPLSQLPVTIREGRVEVAALITADDPAYYVDAIFVVSAGDRQSACAWILFCDRTLSQYALGDGGDQA